MSGAVFVSGLAVVAWLALIAITCSAAVVTIRVYLCRTYPQAVVVAALVLASYMIVVSEWLSAVSLFHVLGIRAAWVTVLAVFVALALLRRDRIPAPTLQLSRGEWITYGLVSLILVLALVTGILVAPNTWDSLSYHLPRALQWLQNGNLGFFTTTISRQNLITRGGDLLTAHLLATASQARLASLGQWGSGLVLVTGVGILTRTLFGRGRPVALAVLFAASIPMFVSQLSTTQVDLIAAVPVVGAVVAVVVWREGQTTLAAVVMALSVALALAVKTTGLIYLLPLLVLFVVLVVAARKWRALGVLAAVAAVAGLAMNGSFLWAVSRSPVVGPEVLSEVFVQNPSLKVFVLNLLRDSAIMMQWTLPGPNDLVQSATDWWIATLGLDPAMAVTPHGASFDLTLIMDESTVGAPLHVVLAFTALCGVALRKALIRRPDVRAYLLILVSQWFLVAATLNWQPWINRFTVLSLVLAAPAVGWMLDAFPRPVRVALVFLLTASAVAWCLLQPLRGLAGTAWLPNLPRVVAGLYRYDSPLAADRFAQVVANTPQVADDYRKALDYAVELQPDAIQLVTGGDDFEYFVWDRMSGLAPVPLIAHAGDDRVAPAPQRRVVRVCTHPCETTDLAAVRTFPETPVDDPFHPVVQLTVGLVE